MATQKDTGRKVLHVSVKPPLFTRIVKLANQENRPTTNMAAVLIEEALKQRDQSKAAI